MKRIFTIILSFFILTPMVFANEDIVFDQSVKSFCENIQPNTVKGSIEYFENGVILPEDSDMLNIRLKPKNEIKRLDTSFLTDVNYDDMNRHKYLYNHIADEYQTLPTYNSIMSKDKNWTAGVVYVSEFDGGEFGYRTRYRARYDAKKYALTFDYGRNQNTTRGFCRDMLYLTPEFKIGKGLSIKEMLKTNVQQDFRGHEIVLQYEPQIKPCQKNKLKLEVSFEQFPNYYSLKFATNFKL